MRAIQYKVISIVADRIQPDSLMQLISGRWFQQSLLDLERRWRSVVADM